MPRCPVISILRSLAWQVLAEWHSDRQDESWADDLCAIWLHDNILRPLELRGKTCSCNSCTYICLHIYLFISCNVTTKMTLEETIRHNPRWLENLSSSNLQPKTCHPIGQWHQSCPVASESRKVASKFNPNSLGVGKSLEKTDGDLTIFWQVRCWLRVEHVVKLHQGLSSFTKKTRKTLTQSSAFLWETLRVPHNHPNVCHFESSTDPPVLAKKRSVASCCREISRFCPPFFPGKLTLPENGSSQKEIPLRTIDFQGRTLSFREGITTKNLGKSPLEIPNDFASLVKVKVHHLLVSNRKKN